MQLHEHQHAGKSLAMPWALDAYDDDLDLEIHGCGCGCSCGGCSCGCSCSCICSSDDGGDDSDGNDAEDDDDSAANDALAGALVDAAALNAAETELEADHSVPEVGKAGVTGPQLPDPGQALACAADVLEEAALAMPDVAPPLIVASASTPAVIATTLAAGAVLEGVEALGSPQRSQCDEAVNEAATFTGQLAQLEAAGQVELQNFASDQVVNAIEDAGERNMAELNAVKAIVNAVVDAVNDFLDDPEGPPTEYDTESSNPNLGG